MQFCIYQILHAVAVMRTIPSLPNLRPGQESFGIKHLYPIWTSLHHRKSQRRCCYFYYVGWGHINQPPIWLL